TQSCRVSKRALVTGGYGFVAQWAMRAMLERGWSVTAAGIGDASSAGVLNATERAAITWRRMDVTDQPDVAMTVDAVSADLVLHLAAISHVPAAMANPAYAYEVNAVGTVRLLAELAKQRRAGVADPVVVVVGSAEQYGRHAIGEMPLGEEVEQRPLTLYAASKVAQEVAALQAFRSDGIRIVCTRSFNHSGVGHASHFLLPSLVRRALKLPTTGGAMSIGNGDTVRDFLHVADVAEAYLLLLEQGRTGEAFNVCSGEGVSVRALASAVLLRLGIKAEIASESTLVRSIDVPVLVGNNDKLRRATGWNPRRNRNDIIDDLIHASTR
nr:GDP-mannose 4,6-dehydratase [Gemmatimonadota bacterium]